MLEPLYTAAEMRAAEEGHDVEVLMECAGRAVAEHALASFGQARSYTVVCGAGANGGDGRIAADALRAAGREVLVVEAKPEDEDKRLGEPDVVVDAMFGTGFSGAPRPAAARLIDAVNSLGRPVVAVDVPSGVDASTGEVSGAAVSAALTVTFHGRKVGLAVSPGSFRAGKVVVADIGLEPFDTEHRRVASEILGLIPRRAPHHDKYSAGAVLVVGGSRGLTGAACLTAEAAFRADAGYVAVAVPESTLPVFEHRLLEAVKKPCAEDAGGRLSADALNEVLELAKRASAVALGPGLGRSDGVTRLVRSLLQRLPVPVVVDADALFQLEPVEREAPTVLTPHAGELARLLGESADWVRAHRLEAVRRVAERFSAVVLLKGADTLVAAPEEGVLVCPVDTPALATAGTGDVLTGVIAALLAKGMDARLAAAAGAAAHAAAARAVPHQVGLVAGDVVAALPRALS